MKRFTYFDGENWYLKINDIVYSEFPFIDRLVAYEETGLTPQEVDEYLYKSYGPLHKKIGRWFDAEKDGRLVVLPCKAGDTIYRVPSKINYALNLVNGFEENNRIYKQVVNEIHFFSNDYLLITYDCVSPVSGKYFGENWFLSNKEAEEKLLSLRENHKHLARKEEKK